MTNERIFAMPFQRVYDCLVAKAERKDRTAAEVAELTCWLTGYTEEALAALRETELCYGDFFRRAPALNPDRVKITGVVCGIRVESIEDPLLQEIRRLDKLVDELAKGKPIEKILKK